MPRLAVLLPVYSSETTLAAALTSTLGALPRDAGVMVLDDGSLDRSAEVARSVDDPRVLVRTRPNGGVASALNELLESTDSEFVARMDADDLVLPGRFARQLRALRDAGSGAERTDAVFTTVVQFGRGARPVPRPSGIAPEDFGMHLMLTNPVAHPTLMARRHALERAGGYRELPTEDYDLWLRMAVTGARLRRLPLPGLAYRIHPDQITASSTWRRASWTDARIGEAYSALSTQLVGAPSQRITTLAVDETLTHAEKHERLELFRARFVTALMGRSPSAQRALRRKLAERVSWFENHLAREKDHARL